MPTNALVVELATLYTTKTAQKIRALAETGFQNNLPSTVKLVDIKVQTNVLPATLVSIWKAANA